MLRSSANLAADDVTITCKVRRSNHAANPEFEDGMQEMTCTMRYWQPAETSPGDDDPPMRGGSHRRNGSKSSDFYPLQLLVGDTGTHDPELVLCPVLPPAGVYSGGPIKLSNRFQSFGSNSGSYPGSRRPSVTRNRAPSDPTSRSGSASRSKSIPRSKSVSRLRRSVWSSEELTVVQRIPKPVAPVEPPVIQNYVIPLSDIVVVDVYSSKNQQLPENDRMNVTTNSNGYYEFNFQTRMSHDLLLAFLKANLPSERIADGIDPNLDSIQPQLSRCCSEDVLFDAETLTARRMEERVQKERLSERVKRNITHVASRLGELSTSIADCACGGAHVAAAADDALRQSPPHTFELPEDLEFSPSCGRLEMSISNLQTTATVDLDSPKPNVISGYPVDDVPAVEKISFEDESVSETRPEAGAIRIA